MLPHILIDSCTETSGALLSVEQALELLIERALPVGEIEMIDVTNALSRVVAEDICSTVDVPASDNSAMDGYAVRSGDISTDKAYWLPVSQRVAAGSCGDALAPGTVARIFTGAPLPRGADAVVMQERCAVHMDGSVRIAGPVSPGANVRRAGEDVQCGSIVVKRGTRLRAQEMGLAAAAGAATLPVFRRVRVALLSSGNELATPGTPLRPGQCFNSNHSVLTGLLRGLGCEVVDGGWMPDDPGATRRALKLAAQETDLVLTSGGVSVGEEDHVRKAVEELGHLDLWRVAIKPGKPLAFGRIGAAAFIGLPGNPVSAFVTFCLFVRPFILRLQGATEVGPHSFWVTAAFERRVAEKRREYLRARLTTENGSTCAVPYPHQGSGVLTSVAWADGLVDIAPGELIERGRAVRFIPFSELLA